MEKIQLREAVFELLRSEPKTQIVRMDNKIKEIVPIGESYDRLELREILWELLIQGILAPGNDGANLDLPFIHVTEYGRRCLETNTILPHDPDGYIERLNQSVGQQLDGTVLAYVRESLLTFLGGHYLAATVMLGVASERCIDLLVEAYSHAKFKDEDKIIIGKIGQGGRSIKNRFDALRKALLSINLPAQLKDALDIQLSAIFTLIRYSRNDAGHPTGRPIDRDVAHGNLLLFPQYCKRVYELIAYFRSIPKHENG